MTAAGNAAMTYLNVQSLGAKGLAKKTAKNTGKTLAKNVIQAHVGDKDGASSEEKKWMPKFIYPTSHLLIKQEYFLAQSYLWIQYCIIWISP